MDRLLRFVRALVGPWLRWGLAALAAVCLWMVVDRGARSAVLGYLSADLGMPRWGALLCGVGLAGGGLLAGWRAAQARLQPGRCDDRQETFFHIRWRWKWSEATGETEPVEIEPFCPDCDALLEREAGYVSLGRSSGREATYVCPQCQRHWPAIDPHEVRERIVARRRSARWIESARQARGRTAHAESRAI